MRFLFSILNIDTPEVVSTCINNVLMCGSFELKPFYTCVNSIFENSFNFVTTFAFARSLHENGIDDLLIYMSSSEDEVRCE